MKGPCLITTRIEKGSIIIDIPMCRCITSAELSGYAVADETALLLWIKQNIADYMEDAAGTTALDTILGKMMDAAYENAENFIELLQEREQ